MISEWSSKVLEECIDRVRCPNKIPKKKFLNSGEFPIVSQEKDLTNGFWSDEEDVFSVSQPIIIFGDHTKIFKFIDFDFVIGADGVKILQPKPFLNSKYFYYYLNAFPVKSLGYARHYRLLKELVVWFPPLPEQKRIVAILDEAFAGIRQAVANAEKNLANARELFESYLNNLFAGEGADWERCTLETLLEREWITSHLDGNHGGDYPRKNEFIASGVPYISANCIKSEQVDFSFSKYLSPERAALLRKGIAHNNDVLFAHNATVGPVAILKTKEEKIILGTSLTYYRCNDNHILPEYLAHYMRSPEFTTQYRQIMRQSTRNQVPITKQRTFIHVIPPLQQQREIALRLDGLEVKIGTLEKIYRKKLTALSELKQSLLQKAFAGELTADH